MKILKLNEMFGGSKFKLGLDFHGVIDDLSSEFKFMADAIIKAGGEVHIITGGPWKEVGPQVEQIGINYTHNFSIRDYHEEKGTATSGNHAEYGFPLIDDAIWDRTKGDYCKEHGISLMIDDTLEYGDDFSTPFARLWTKNKTKKVDREGRSL